MTATSAPRTWMIFRHRVRDDVLSLPMVWAGFLVAVAAVVALVAIFRADGIEVSGWEQATRITRWYVGAIGGYFTAVYLPLYVTHGVTRREFTAQLPALVVAFVAMYAVVMTVGFGIESVAYRIFDWPQVLTDQHLFDRLSQVGLVLLEFVLTGLVWTVAGAVLGAAFYRNGLLGGVLVPVAVAMVWLTEAATGTGYLGPFGAAFDAAPSWLTGLRAAPVWATAVAIVVAAAGLGLVHVLTRTMPIRNPGS